MTKKEWARQRYETKYKPAYAALMKFYPLTLEDLPGEEWLPIPAYEELYHESNYGRTKSFCRGKVRIIPPHSNGKGYLHVFLSRDGKRKQFRIHRLVAELFVSNPEGKPQVNHRDGVKFNNHVSNLEWATPSENMHHAYDTGLAPLGEEHGQAKLTNEQIVHIRNNPDRLTTVDLAKLFRVKQTTISDIQLGKIWKQARGIVRQPKCTRVSNEIKEQIRAEYVFGSTEFGSYGLAKKYGVNHVTILNIVHEK